MNKLFVKIEQPLNTNLLKNREAIESDYLDDWLKKHNTIKTEQVNGNEMLTQANQNGSSQSPLHLLG